MNSLQEKRLILYLCLYPVIKWCDEKSLGILWKITDCRARCNSLNTRGVWSYIVHPTFCYVSCFSLNEQQQKEGTVHSQNKKLPLGMPAPLVQIPAAWKLLPVERSINFVGKFMTCTHTKKINWKFGIHLIKILRQRSWIDLKKISEKELLRNDWTNHYFPFLDFCTLMFAWIVSLLPVTVIFYFHVGRYFVTVNSQ